MSQVLIVFQVLRRITCFSRSAKDASMGAVSVVRRIMDIDKLHKFSLVTTKQHITLRGREHF